VPGNIREIIREVRLYKVQTLLVLASNEVVEMCDEDADMLAELDNYFWACRQSEARRNISGNNDDVVASVKHKAKRTRPLFVFCLSLLRFQFKMGILLQIFIPSKDVICPALNGVAALCLFVV